LHKFQQFVNSLQKTAIGNGNLQPEIEVNEYFTTTTATVLRPIFRDHPGEPVPEENFWTLWHKGRLTEADTPTVQLGATPFGPISAHHPRFFTNQMSFLPPNQQCQSTEGN